jgi:hypothetical protein
MTSFEDLRIFRWEASEPMDWTLKGRELTYIYFFGLAEAETIPQLQEIRSADRFVQMIAVFTGQERLDFPWAKTCSQFVYWAGPAGLETALCLRYGVNRTPALLILDGGQVIRRLASLPEDWNDLPKATYRSLVAGLEAGQSPICEEIYEKYRSGEGGLEGLMSVLEGISEEIKLDLQGAVLHLTVQGTSDAQNIPQEQFMKRLKEYCESQLNKDKYAELKHICKGVAGGIGRFAKSIGIGETQRNLEQSLLSANAKISQQAVEIQEKEETIARLQRELADSKAEIAILKAPPRPPTPPELPIPGPAAPPEDDEYRFWKYEKEDDWDPMQHHPHPSKFEEIAKAKGLWLMTAETTGVVDSSDLGLKLFSKKKKTSYGPSGLSTP